MSSVTISHSLSLIDYHYIWHHRWEKDNKQDIYTEETCPQLYTDPDPDCKAKAWCQFVSRTTLESMETDSILKTHSSCQERNCTLQHWGVGFSFQDLIICWTENKLVWALLMCQQQLVCLSFQTSIEMCWTSLSYLHLHKAPNCHCLTQIWLSTSLPPHLLLSLITSSLSLISFDVFSARFPSASLYFSHLTPLLFISPWYKIRCSDVWWASGCWFGDWEWLIKRRKMGRDNASIAKRCSHWSLRLSYTVLILAPSVNYLSKCALSIPPFLSCNWKVWRSF